MRPRAQHSMASHSVGISQGCQALYLWRVDAQLQFLLSKGTLCPASSQQFSGPGNEGRDNRAGLQAPLPCGVSQEACLPGRPS